jgi:hypothetical protein
MYNGELQGDDLELAILATDGGNTQEEEATTSLSLSLSLGCSLFTLSEWKNRKMSNNIQNCLP